jgi:hypothetical protein
MVDAAVGSRALLARAIEKVGLGIPQGAVYDFLRFDSAELGRTSAENPSEAITGSAGEDRGTPGMLTYSDNIKYDMTADRVLFDLVAMFGKPLSIDVLTAAEAWLVKFRPTGAEDLRAASFHYYEGGSYGASAQYGRRCHTLTLADAANKRVGVTANYADPTGDSISGYAIEKSDNAGTETEKTSTRGRRPYDADYVANKSVFIKINSIASGVATCSATIATAGDGLGGGFPVAYDAATFLVSAPDDATGHSGWTTVVTDAGPLGLFGANNEAFQVTFGNNMTGRLVGDEWEFPVAMVALTPTGGSGTRMSTFHNVRLLNNDLVAVHFDKGSVKLSRPYKAYFANGQRLPFFVDPTDSLGATTQFTQRLATRFFREINDASARFSVHDKWAINSAISATASEHETVEIFQPVCRVQTLKSGDVSNKNTLEETVTLEAEQPQPDDTVTAPHADFESVTTLALQINVITKVDPTGLAD